MLAAVLSHAGAHRDRYLADVAALAAIPSVSADPARRADVARAARWLVDRLRAAGLANVGLVRTPGAPAVVGRAGPGDGRPTLLVYGHYDVQPAGPAAAWSHGAFRPTLRGDLLIGRGVSDDKGQLFTHLAAIESWLAVAGALPVNVVVVLDGEEEVGSPHLARVLDTVWAGRVPDAAVVSDTRMRDVDTPALTVSLRGSLHCRLTVRGAATDLHSGAYGGVVADPARELCRIVAGLHDRYGRLRAGLDTGTRPRPGRTPGDPSDRELLALARAAVPGPGTVEAGWTAYERGTVRPALVVSALDAGLTGGRGRAVVVAQARAHLNLRLAPGQDPRRMHAELTRRIRALARPGTRAELTVASAAPPVELPVSGPVVAAARAACRHGFGVEPVLLRAGGTIPAVYELAVRRGVPTVLIGFALPDDRMHAPDERLSVRAFDRGVRTAAAFLLAVSRR
ncbi:M20/M25/M40 family metallo-hydrolase [Rugosimonospora africana]|uniref:Peptidase M20 n=1 Tax=Rugosimonospora africana TaxID=556532 RepID=A0A8J3QSZ2_9ACTN|nr:M20/M25/M40 family metallo-hydrolase [Rugosimonospora africana]GIH15901.1 peptidase M20 [Rugosimonospora africana]